MNINININEVVLRGIGFRESQSLDLQRALQSEIVGLATSHSSDLDTSFFVASTQLESPPNSTPRELAVGLTHSISQFMQSQNQ